MTGYLLGIGSFLLQAAQKRGLVSGSFEGQAEHALGAKQLGSLARLVGAEQ